MADNDGHPNAARAGPRTDKWDTRYRDADPLAARPARVLTENAHLLPTSGHALELACGLGANALWLAKHGLEVSAWDASSVAVAKLVATAREQRLPITAEVRDILANPPPPASCDVIVISHFLERQLAPSITAALRPQGLLFYQTFIREHISAFGPSNPAYRLQQNELLRLFADLIVLVYREEGRVGDITRGFRDEALLVGMKA